MKFPTLLALSLLFSTQLQAVVTLPNLIADNMVLQRDTAIRIWGWADDEHVVRIYLDDKLVAKSPVNNGHWQTTLQAQKASGPHQLAVEGDNRITISNVYFGDVWVASGQSNMELKMYRVAEAFPEEQTGDFPQIRQFTVPQKYNFDGPQLDTRGGAWHSANDDTIPQFSAVAFFFAKHLFRHNNVAIGIINNALGGSPVEAWMSEEALGAYPDALAQAYRYRDNAYLQAVIDKNLRNEQQWYSQLDKDDIGLTGKTPWYSPELNDSDWQMFSVPGYRELAKGEHFNGVWWFRKTVTLTAAQADSAKIIRLGRIVDADHTYINGVKVGSTSYQYPPRRYTLPAGLLKEGDNQITIRVIANSGRSGFLLDKPYWIGSDDSQLSLRGLWRVKTAAYAMPPEPYTFIRWQPMGLFNGLTAPLTQFPIKGVIWYQGESNTARYQDYQQKFSAMIKDWRAKWGQGDFPFLFVQLANFMAPSALPQESDWAALRDAQSKSLDMTKTAMAVAIDVGEWNDIHPLNKKAVGDRLALAARNVAYGEDVVHSGPMLRKATRQGSQVSLVFNFSADGLVLKDEAKNAFALAADDGLFKWVKPQLKNNKILLVHPDIEQPRYVRYAWADNPNSILYNSAQLPAVPFSVAITK